MSSLLLLFGLCTNLWNVRKVSGGVNLVQKFYSRCLRRRGIQLSHKSFKIVNGAFMVHSCEWIGMQQLKNARVHLRTTLIAFQFSWSCKPSQTDVSVRISWYASMMAALEDCIDDCWSACSLFFLALLLRFLAILSFSRSNRSWSVIVLPHIQGNHKAIPADSSQV